MTIDECGKCPYIENAIMDYGATMLCCGKSNEVIIVSLKDYKTVKNKCPIENPTGRWIKHECSGIEYIECSECFSWFLRSHLLRNSYCPNCGMKMESEVKYE